MDLRNFKMIVYEEKCNLKRCLTHPWLLETMTAEELMDIFKHNLKKSRYKIKRDAYELLQEKVSAAVSVKDKNFGNARYIRNLFERVIQQQANRLAKQISIVSEDLSLITKEDILNL